MAEDEEETGEEYTEDEEAIEEGVGFSTQRSRSPKSRKCCNHRIDELSTPYRRIFLALWNEHAYHLPKDKVKNLKLLLRQLYAMSPEETAKYFAELRAEARAAAMRKKLKQKLRKYLMDKHHQRQRQRAFKLFRRLLKCGISYAARNPVPPLVSIRLRYLSNIILEQLCDLRCVDVPNRSNPDKIGNFLISVADWMAIAVERLYFAAQISINQLTVQDDDTSLLQDETFDLSETYKDFGPPAASSTPQKMSLDSQNKTMQVPSKFEDMGQPAGASTPKKLSLDPNNQTTEQMKPPSRLSLKPYYSIIEAKPVASSNPKKSKIPTKKPLYNFQNAKNEKLCLDKSRLEMPPYRFPRKRSQTSATKESLNEKSNTQSFTHRTINKNQTHCIRHIK